MAKACLEMAVLDSELRPQGRSLADRLGAVRDEVECGAVVALVRQEGHGGQKDPLDMIKGLVDEGYRRVKVKIAPGADLELLSAVRHAFPILSIQADANGSYSLDDASHLRSLESLDDLDLLCLEQPLNPDDLLGHSKLAEILDTPICLDESITSLGRIRDAIALSACDVICIKPARLGGFLQAARAHDICAAAGIPVFCGGMLETNFARCANAALAALPGFTLPGDLQVGNRFAEPDPFGVGSGIGSPTPATIGVYRGPGVGPAPDMELLDRITARSLYLRI
jgi:O-succinylbenzoate synthase